MHAASEAWHVDSNTREGRDGRGVLTRKAATANGERIAVLSSFIKINLPLLSSLLCNTPFPRIQRLAETRKGGTPHQSKQPIMREREFCSLCGIGILN